MLEIVVTLAIEAVLLFGAAFVFGLGFALGVSAYAKLASKFSRS